MLSGSKGTGTGASDPPDPPLRPSIGRPVEDLTSRQRRAFARLERLWSSLGPFARERAVREVPGAPEEGTGDVRFLATGREEVARVAARAAALGRPFPGGRVLDFGCGPDRMAQALAEYFDTKVGLDGSDGMVRLARELNRVGDRCQFVGSAFPDLRLFRDGEFDATFSVYVLQHLPQWLMARYLREFARVTRPGGSLVFQVHGGLTS
ncbi:MAG TPA: class I SAM-dependent methyltransferase [Thermoplasmata archaeon]|nr:class I SAM-dependent methyltransferase [Thermoplasmata archaeon]HEV2429018.1 class I SAM-dependent methyltransferase [Thermoplasmata archaeon]